MWSVVIVDDIVQLYLTAWLKGLETGMFEIGHLAAIFEVEHLDEVIEVNLTRMFEFHFCCQVFIFSMHTLEY